MGTNIFFKGKTRWFDRFPEKAWKAPRFFAPKVFHVLLVTNVTGSGLEDLWKGRWFELNKTRWWFQTFFGIFDRIPVCLQLFISHHGVGFSPLLAVFYLLKSWTVWAKKLRPNKNSQPLRSMAISKLVSCWRWFKRPQGLPEKFALKLRCILFLGEVFEKLILATWQVFQVFFTQWSWKFFGRCDLNKTWLYIKFLISDFFNMAIFVGVIHTRVSTYS